MSVDNFFSSYESWKQDGNKKSYWLSLVVLLQGPKQAVKLFHQNKKRLDLQFVLRSEVCSGMLKKRTVFLKG